MSCFFEREGQLWFCSVGSFFDIVVCGICVVDVFLSFLSMLIVLKNFLIPTFLLYSAVLGRFLILWCVIDVLVAFFCMLKFSVSGPILQDTRLPRPYYSL